MEVTNKIGALYAYDVSSTGMAAKLDPDSIGPFDDQTYQYRWVHLDLDHPGTLDWIKRQTDTHIAQALTVEDTRPRCHRLENGILLNLRGVNLNPHSDPEDMVSIRLWISDHQIISVRRRKLMSIVRLRESLDKNEAPASVGSFIAELTKSLTERMDGVIEDLSDKVDDFEETSLDRAETLKDVLVSLRRSTLHLRRYIGPQREALGQLESEPLFTAQDLRSLRDTHDRITRIVEELDAIRERSSILNEQLINIRAEEMNRNMLILSVVAAIFLPLGFLTGLLGVNIAGIPGSDYPYAFIVFCGLLLMISVGLLAWFRQKDWI